MFTYLLRLSFTLLQSCSIAFVFGFAPFLGGWLRLRFPFTVSNIDFKTMSSSLQNASHRVAKRLLSRPLRSLSSQQQPQSLIARRWFSAEAAPAQDDTPLSSPKVQALYDKVITLPEEDVNALGAVVIQVLGCRIFPGEFGGGGVAVAGGEAVAADEVQEEKTIFDLKLLGFDAKAKIKVIKEVRSIAGLGLKEAKELVDGAPKVIQKDLKPEKAEELKAQLEAVGAKVEVL
jgi:large subunit ribosomal protein L7/L12